MNKKQDEQFLYSLIPPRKKIAQIDLESAETWSNAFKLNKHLIHVDLSHNNFDSRELQIISKGLNQNHEILGIHLEGNECTVGVEGFIECYDMLGVQNSEDCSKHMLYTRLQPNLKMGQIKDQYKLRYQAISNCWICEGWSQFSFQFRPSQFIDLAEGEIVKIHLSIDDYQGQLIDYEEEEVEIQQIENGFNDIQKQNGLQKKYLKQQVFKTVRMLPPGPIFYYFTINDRPFINEDEQNLNLIGNHDRINNSNVDQAIKIQIQKLNVPQTNYIKNIIQSNELINDNYLANLIAKPRPPPLVIAKRLSLKTPWDYYKSIFKAYKIDNDKTIDECFEIDWPQTKIEKIIKDENQLEQIREFIKQNYKYIRQAYKYYSGIMPLGRLTCMTTQTVTEMLYNCREFIDNKTIKLADIDLQIIACNGGKKSTSFLDPEKALVRYQFMEVLIRLALDKYLKTDLAQSSFHAVEMAFQHNFLPHFKNFDCHSFRKNYLWREEMHIVLTRLEKGLQEIYKKFSGRYQATGQKSLMSLDEFIDLITYSELIDENFSSREIGPIFAQSIMTNKNETESDRHLYLNNIEFYELLGRCAEKFDVDKLEDFFPSYKSKHPKRLDKKLESICLILMNKILNPKQYLQFYNKYKEIVEAEINNPKETKFKLK